MYRNKHDFFVGLQIIMRHNSLKSLSRKPEFVERGLMMLFRAQLDTTLSRDEHKLMLMYGWIPRDQEYEQNFVWFFPLETGKILTILSKREIMDNDEHT